MKRLVYLDVLRGLAILMMVTDHAYDWWLTEAERGTVASDTFRFIGTLSAPLFFYLAGVGLALSTRRSVQQGQPRRAIAVRHLWRGGTLILWGYALNLLVFFVGENTVDLFAVDVLQIIGICIWLSIPLLWTTAPAVLVVALVITILGQTAGNWMLPDWLDAYLTGTGGIGYFPLALWLPYSYLGLAVGKWIGEATQQGRVMVLLATAGLLAALGSALVHPAWGYRHPRPVFSLFALLVIFWLTVGLWLWTERLGRVGPVIRVLRDMGMTSLVLYVFHHLIGYRLFWLLGWVTGRSWRGEYGVFDLVEATALFVVLVGLMLVVSRAWLGWKKKRASR